jgi:hypothetical protein
LPVVVIVQEPPGGLSGSWCIFLRCQTGSKEKQYGKNEITHIPEKNIELISCAKLLLFRCLN